MPLLPSLAPMLASTGVLPPDDGRWAVEVKWDGVRALAAVQHGRLTLRSRNGNDITAAYPELVSPPCTALLDGEIVALGPDGNPDFGLLQSRMHVRGPSAELVRAVPVSYLVFDVLHVGDRSLLSCPYDERRAVLAALDLPFQLSPFFTEDTAAVAAATKEQRLEGVVAKRRDSRYEPGRRSDCWVKVKHVRRQSAVVGGWKPGDGGRAGQLGSLLLGVQTDAGLAYAGHVGSGFTAATLRQVGERLAVLRRADPPFATEVPLEHARPAVWVEPVLVVDVDVTGWTREGRLRHPSYKGMRDDLDPALVVREQ